MNIQFRTHKKHAEHLPLENNSFYDNAIGTWATVESVNSEMNTVDVITNQGVEYKNIPVASTEWVNNDKDNKDFFTGERKLPLVNSYVFILMPFGSIHGSFVLCSGFPRGEKDTGGFLASNSTDDKDKKDNERELITAGAWHFRETYKSGTLHLENKDNGISIDIVNENSDSIKKNITINAWDNTIKIDDEKGVTIEIAKKIDKTIRDETTIQQDKKLTINTGTDEKKHTTTEIDAGNVSLTLDGTLELKSTKETLDATSGDTLGKMISNLLEQLLSMQTVGSPATHVPNATFIQAVMKIKQNWDAIFI